MSAEPPATIYFVPPQDIQQSTNPSESTSTTDTGDKVQPETGETTTEPAPAVNSGVAENSGTTTTSAVNSGVAANSGTTTTAAAATAPATDDSLEPDTNPPQGVSFQLNPDLQARITGRVFNPQTNTLDVYFEKDYRFGTLTVPQSLLDQDETIRVILGAKLPKAPTGPGGIATGSLFEFQAPSTGATPTYQLETPIYLHDIPSYSVENGRIKVSSGGFVELLNSSHRGSWGIPIEYDTTLNKFVLRFALGSNPDSFITSQVFSIDLPAELRSSNSAESLDIPMSTLEPAAETTTTVEPTTTWPETTPQEPDPAAQWTTEQKDAHSIQTMYNQYATDTSEYGIQIMKPAGNWRIKKLPNCNPATPPQIDGFMENYPVLSVTCTTVPPQESRTMEVWVSTIHPTEQEQTEQLKDRVRLGTFTLDATSMQISLSSLQPVNSQGVKEAAVELDRLLTPSTTGSIADSSGAFVLSLINTSAGIKLIAPTPPSAFSISNAVSLNMANAKITVEERTLRYPVRLYLEPPTWPWSLPKTSMTNYYAWMCWQTIYYYITVSQDYLNACAGPIRITMMSAVDNQPLVRIGEWNPTNTSKVGIARTMLQNVGDPNSIRDSRPNFFMENSTYNIWWKFESIRYPQIQARLPAAAGSSIQAKIEIYPRVTCNQGGGAKRRGVTRGKRGRMGTARRRNSRT